MRQAVKRWGMILGGAALIWGTSGGWGGAGELHKVRVTVGQRGLWDTTMGFVIGEKKGFFAREGITLDIFYTRGGAETLQPVATGNAEFGWANGTFGVLGAYEKGAAVKIVSAEFTGSDVFWYVKADSPYRTFGDLVGQKIGFSSPGSSSHVILLRMMELSKFTAEAVPVGGVPDNFTAVMTGQIAAGWAVPPFRLADAQKGLVRIIARGDEFKELKDITFRVNIANAAFLKKSPDVARAFLRAYQRSLDYMYANSKEAMAAFADFNKLSPEVADLAFQFYPKRSLALSPVKGVEFQVKKAVDFKFLTKELTKEQLQDLIAREYLPR